MRKTVFFLLVITDDLFFKILIFSYFFLKNLNDFIIFWSGYYSNENKLISTDSQNFAHAINVAILSIYSVCLQLTTRQTTNHLIARPLSNKGGNIPKNKTEKIVT